jgi:hypothetical protein
MRPVFDEFLSDWFLVAQTSQSVQPDWFKKRVDQSFSWVLFVTF